MKGFGVAGATQMAKAKNAALSAEAQETLVARIREEHSRWLAARAPRRADRSRSAARGRPPAGPADALGAAPAPAGRPRPLVDILPGRGGTGPRDGGGHRPPDDAAAGQKFFECVGGAEQRFQSQLKQLQAGDSFVVLWKGDRAKVTAVGAVGGPQLPRQADGGALLAHLPAERREATQEFLGDAPSYKAVFFSEVFDCASLDIDLGELVAPVSGLARPPALLGPGFSSQSAGARDALFKFLPNDRCPLRGRGTGPGARGAGRGRAAGRQAGGLSKR